jgi:17beta-estradiol 17-dehydrogenase / very-long-chain 3-oxoacyl-CoA reductase
MSNTFAINALGMFGLASVCMMSYRCLKFAWKYWIRPFPALKQRYAGAWAIITGGSAGIGLAIAKILVKAGVNVLIMSRDVAKLQSAAQALETLALSSSSCAQVQTLSMDASTPDFPAIQKSLNGLNVALLINNVGVHNHIPTSVDDMDLTEINRIVSVNCTFQVQLTSMIIPLLKQTSSHRPAAIVNISSLTSRMAMPLLSAYAASKAFDDHFSTNLAAELQPFNIQVLCLRPGITASQMSGITKPSLFCPSSHDMALACVRMIDSGEHIIAPYWPHAILDIVNEYVPGKAFSWQLVRKMHEDKRALMLKDK